MPLTSLFYAFLELTSHTLSVTGQNHPHSQSLGTCYKIAAGISNASQVFYPGSSQYASDISHYALSSIQNSTCSVEPGSAKDVSKILKILGAHKTPFAVKSGGHTTNPGFSSTTGVEIAMSRFNSIKVNANDGTVEIGSGLTWGQVYKTLDPTGVNVVGARFSDVGVAGPALGGGYSYQSSRYGLVIDNVAGYELVLPNGTIKQVTQKDDDLWFGLKGGLNNFGIVTKFILKLHPQTDVWGGTLFYNEDKLNQIKDSLVKFQEKNDPKAAVMVTFAYISGQITPFIFYFYDAPNRPMGVFDDFLAIKSVKGGVSTLSYSDFILSENALGPSTSFRNFYVGVPVTQYSPTVFDAFVNHTRVLGEQVTALDSTALVAATLEPFDSNLFSHGSPSAYPPDRSQAVFPSDINLAWSNSSLDKTMADFLRGGAKAIHDVAVADGQNLSHAAVYVNYALFDTPLEDMYGSNLARLRQIKAKIDPKRVMDLAGGFKF